MQMTAIEIARLVGGELTGDGSVLVCRPGKIEEGGEGTLTFLGNPKYEHYAYTVKSAVLLAGKEFNPSGPVAAAALIRVEDVYDAIRLLLGQFGYQHDAQRGEISDRADIHPEAILASGVSVGAFSVVEKKVKIGAGSIVYSQVFLGHDVEIGRGCILYPGVKIHHGCKIGNHCILHANVVIGSDGFGFAPQPDGSYRKIPQIGNVVIEDHVEIGANTTIDRATMGSTLIRKGVKLDNLIMVAHNVDIGQHTAVAAQAGIAGSTTIGHYCRIGGQAGFVGHIEVADHSQVQAQSGVAASLRQPHKAWYGSPALPYKNYLKSYAVFKQLPELYKKICDLEHKLNKQ
ncbi:MAG TPA: UDP-3-O-(3-hydroxymyristoyl)glucosamine N-acyltransferase [Bacteroidetes bacterium]|nr:UDP-3-O-(3-hydroxymyristoyl)glucosamine N-acyltransferase [Bacteroidota bacterium]